jgi:uncharacterized phage infection (PIP) family protein YhgE
MNRKIMLALVLTVLGTTSFAMEDPGGGGSQKRFMEEVAEFFFNPQMVQALFKSLLQAAPTQTVKKYTMEELDKMRSQYIQLFKQYRQAKEQNAPQAQQLQRQLQDAVESLQLMAKVLEDVIKQIEDKFNSLPDKTSSLADRLQDKIKVYKQLLSTIQFRLHEIQELSGVTK